MKKVVVFGGSGFIGSHTADELSNQGYQVTIFDREKSPYLRNDQEMIIGDILDKHAVEDALKGVSIVYHFAGIADLGEASSRPYDTINLNIMGVTTVLDAAVNEKIERLFMLQLCMYTAIKDLFTEQVSKLQSKLSSLTLRNLI